MIRVLSYNIHKGFSTHNRKFVLSGIREAIRTANADLVFLQEVLGQHEGHAKTTLNWPTTSQFEYLADEIWHHSAYGKNAIYEEGHHGNALLSKYPITEWSNYRVSTSRFEHRGLLHATIAMPGLGSPLHCICVHLGLTRRGRRGQLEMMCDRVHAHIPSEVPLIIAGDFNDWSLTASKVMASKIGAHEVFKKLRGKHAVTFPAQFPMLRLDRIYCRGLEMVSAKVLRGSPWKKLSDHAALYAEFRIVVV